MKLTIGLLPIKDPHMQKTNDDWILKYLVIQRLELLGVPDHVCPQGIIVVELREGIFQPTCGPLKKVVTLLPWKDCILLTAFRNLRGVNISLVTIYQRIFSPGMRLDKDPDQSCYGHSSWSQSASRNDDPHAS